MSRRSSAWGVVVASVAAPLVLFFVVGLLQVCEGTIGLAVLYGGIFFALLAAGQTVTSLSLAGERRMSVWLPVVGAAAGALLLVFVFAGPAVWGGAVAGAILYAAAFGALLGAVHDLVFRLPRAQGRKARLKVYLSFAGLLVLSGATFLIAGHAVASRAWRTPGSPAGPPGPGAGMPVYVPGASVVDFVVDRDRELVAFSIGDLPTRAGRTLHVLEVRTGNVTEVHGLPGAAASVIPMGWAGDSGELVCAAACTPPGLDVELYSVVPGNAQAAAPRGRGPAGAPGMGPGCLLVDSCTLVVSPAASAPRWAGPVVMEQTGGRWRARLVGEQPGGSHRSVLWARREGDSVRLVVQDCEFEVGAEDAVQWRAASRAARTFRELLWRDGQIARVGRRARAPGECCGDGVACGDGSRVFVPAVDSELRRYCAVLDLSDPSAGPERLDVPEDAREAFPSPDGSALLALSSVSRHGVLRELSRAWVLKAGSGEVKELGLPEGAWTVSGVAWLDNDRVLLSVPALGLVELDVATGRSRTLLSAREYLVDRLTAGPQEEPPVAPGAGGE